MLLIGTSSTSIAVCGVAAHCASWLNKNPTPWSGALLLQSSTPEISSTRSLCSTDRRLRVHPHKVGSRTVFHLSPQQIVEQSRNRRVRRHRLGLRSPWLVLRSDSFLGQVVQKLIPQLGVLRLILFPNPDVVSCSSSALR